MLKVRKGVFETNSSSVHSIVIDVSGTPEKVNEGMTISGGEYGWSYMSLDDVDERADYLWQGICDCRLAGLITEQQKDDLIEHIQGWLPNVELREPVGEDPDYDNDDFDYSDYYCPGIDHSGCLSPLIEQLWKDDELLGAYLTGKASHVICSNDNQDTYGFSYPDCDYIEFVKGN